MSKPSAFAKVTPSNQISLPKQIREHLKLEIGDYVVFFIKSDNEVVIKARV